MESGCFPSPPGVASTISFGRAGFSWVLQSRCDVAKEHAPYERIFERTWRPTEELAPMSAGSFCRGTAGFFAGFKMVTSGPLPPKRELVPNENFGEFTDLVFLSASRFFW